ncbi:MAG: hypothetical protein ACRDTM_06280 [Micromonosporaceae bacterium]
MSIAEVAVQLRRVVADTDAAVAAVQQARVELAGSLTMLSAATAGSSHYLAQQAIAQTRAGYAASEVILQQLYAAKRELEAYLTEITGGNGGGGDIGGGGPVAGSAPRDPAFDKGPLGADFTPGVFRREEFEHVHERDTADHIAGERGGNVHARRVIPGRKNPDAMVRWDPSDPGTVTEFKRPTRLSYSAVRRSVFDSGVQVRDWGGGDAVIDGRDLGLRESDARRLIGDAVAEGKRKGKLLPNQIHVILGGGSMITIAGV